MSGYSPEEFRRTQLHEAVIDKDLEAVRKAIANGDDVNARDRADWTPLHFAAQDHLVNIAKALLEAGAVVDAQDSHGNTPLWRAIMNGYHGNEMIGLLKANGADPTIKNLHGISALDMENDTA